MTEYNYRYYLGSEVWPQIDIIRFRIGPGPTKAQKGPFGAGNGKKNKSMTGKPRKLEFVFTGLVIWSCHYNVTPENVYYDYVNGQFSLT